MLCSCPPGGSSYTHPPCCFIDPCGKRDEPDLVFLMGNSLVVAECKPTLRGLLTSAKGEEADAEKLRRIGLNLEAGFYNKQLLHNYGLDFTRVKAVTLGLCYARSKRGKEDIPPGFTCYIVDPQSGTVTVDTTGFLHE